MGACLTGTVPALCNRMTQPSVLENLDPIYRALVTCAPEPMTVLDERGIIAFENNAAQGLTGHPPQQHLGRNFLDTMEPDDREPTQAALERALVVLEPTRLPRFRRRHRDGRRVSLESLAQCVDVDGSRLALIHSRDVTEQEHLEARLRHAQKLNLLGRLTVGLADDFEHVVTTMRDHLPGMFELAAGRPAPIGLRAIVRAIEKAGSLTRQLRVFCETTPRTCERVDVHAVLSGLRRAIPDHLWIRVVPHAVRTVIRIDRGSFGLALHDLVLGLHHTMQDHGVVAISTRNVSDEATRSVFGQDVVDYLVIELTNRGTAEPTEDPLRLFDRYSLPIGAGAIRPALVTLDDTVSHAGGFVEVAALSDDTTTIRAYLPLD